MRPSHRLQQLKKAFMATKDSDITRSICEYIRLLVDQKIEYLVATTGEEAIVIRGEIKCLRHILSVLEQGNGPEMDTI